jgi:hypothetical protein
MLKQDRARKRKNHRFETGRVVPTGCPIGTNPSTPIHIETGRGAIDRKTCFSTPAFGEI